MRWNWAVLAAFLCAGGPAATGMCDPTDQMTPFDAGQWPTMSDSAPELQRTVAAPDTTTLGATSLPEPAVALLTLPEATAWSVVKTTVGGDIVVLRPSWLPERFRTETVMVEYAYTSIARYRVGYSTEDGLILIAAGAINSAAPDQSLAIDIGSVSATYSETSSWPERQVMWIQNGVQYSIQARGVTKEELVRVALGLVAPWLPSTSTND